MILKLVTRNVSNLDAFILGEEIFCLNCNTTIGQMEKTLNGQVFTSIEWNGCEHLVSETARRFLHSLLRPDNAEKEIIKERA